MNHNNSQHLLRDSLTCVSQCSKNLACVNLFNAYRKLSWGRDHYYPNLQMTTEAPSSTSSESCSSVVVEPGLKIRMSVLRLLLFSTVHTPSSSHRKRREGTALRDGIERIWCSIKCERGGSAMTPKCLAHDFIKWSKNSRQKFEG